MTQRCLLTVHAHPDDEASKGASTCAMYAEQGVRTVLVCATGGEEGDIHNPAMESEEVRSRLVEVRQEELAKSASIIGFSEVHMLGYRDSGMPDSDANHHPDCFARADLTDATERLVKIIRAERPQVILTYGDDQKYYPHPDHLQVHSVSIAAFHAAADASRFPDAGEPWQPLKLYYSTWSKKRFIAMAEKFEELGLENPFPKDWLDREWQDHRITTTVDVSGYLDVMREALLAHATQVDPNSPFWFGLPSEHARTVHPYEHYVLAHSHVKVELPEDDLFAGIPTPAP